MAKEYDSLNSRTKSFAVNVVLFAKKLEALPVIRWLARQLVLSATSVAANQRAARRARSDKELAAKLSIIVEEADEAAFWCEFLQEVGLPKELLAELDLLAREAGELTAIYSTGRSTIRRRIASKKKG
jgi:four helix bundle protein